MVAGYDTPVLGDFALQLTATANFIGNQQSKLEENGIYHDPLFGGSYVVGKHVHAYHTANLRAQLSKDFWSIALYMDNVLNTKSPIADDNFFPAFGQSSYYVPPRTVGLEVSAKW